MKIIISPSKTMKPCNHSIMTTTPMFQKKSNQLRNIITNYSQEDLIKRLHVSKNLSMQLINKLNDSSTYPALFYYTGTVFQQLQLENYHEDEFMYIQKYLHILDAMYGALNYNDAIAFYRLDFLCNLDINLYDYWSNSINQLYQNEDIIINLASKEFSKLIQHPHLITIDFCIRQNGQLKRPSMAIKKARGMMLHQMICQQVTNIQNITQITFDHFHYCKEQSNSSTLVFIQETNSKRETN